MFDAPTQKRMDRLEKLARALDSQFTLPGTGIKFGWDGLLGLVPGLGDAITIGPAVFTISEAYQLGARKRVLLQMGVNTGLDLTVGAIPIFGDIFDFAFKANRKNFALLKKEMEHKAKNGALPGQAL